VLVVLARIVGVVERAHRAPATIPQYEEHDRVLDGVLARTLYHELHIGRQKAASSPILRHLCAVTSCALQAGRPVPPDQRLPLQMPTRARSASSPRSAGLSRCPDAPSTGPAHPRARPPLATQAGRDDPGTGRRAIPPSSAALSAANAAHTGAPSAASSQPSTRASATSPARSTPPRTHAAAARARPDLDTRPQPLQLPGQTTGMKYRLGCCPVVFVGSFDRDRGLVGRRNGGAGRRAFGLRARQ
jgi:hypothetical protein